MKARFGFVSNSSSCSFVVGDISAFVDKLFKLSHTKNGMDFDTYWMYGIQVRFEFKNTEENLKVFKSFVDRYDMHAYKKDEWMYAYGDLEKFLSLEPGYYKDIKDFELYAYDDCGNDDIQKLALLYWAMKAEGIDVDNETSEHGFELFTDVPMPIVSAALKAFNLEDTTEGSKT